MDDGVVSSVDFASITFGYLIRNFVSPSSSAIVLSFAAWVVEKLPRTEMRAPNGGLRFVFATSVGALSTSILAITVFIFRRQQNDYWVFVISQCVL